MLIVAQAADTSTYESDSGPAEEAGTLYEIQSCPDCNNLVLVSGPWHEGMEGPEEWVPTVLLPELDDREARQLLLARNLDVRCMHVAVSEARCCSCE